MNPPHTSPFRGNRLLDALPQADRALLEPHLKEVTLTVRDVLHEPLDEIEQVYFLRSGMISILAVSDDGEAIETATVGSEGAVGAIAALGIRHASGRAIVQIAADAARISTAHLQKAARDSERIRDMIMRSHAMQSVQSHQMAACGALHDVESRLARWLLQAQDRAEGPAIPLIQEFLAQVLGVRRTTVNLVIGALQKAGLIRYRRGKVEIADRAALMNQSCACYRIVRKQIDLIAPVEGA